MSSQEIDRREHVVYRLLDADGVLLYVGMTMNVSSRWSAHELRKHWWPEVASAITEDYQHRPGATRAERRAIWHESPKYNVTHNYDNIVSARPPAVWA